MRRENHRAHDRLEALITDLRVDFAEFAAAGASGPAAGGAGS